MIGLLVRLARIVFLVFLLRLALRALAAWLRPQGPATAPGSVPLVRDRVCNTFLPRARALTATLGGRLEYFCSAECRARASAPRT